MVFKILIEFFESTTIHGFSHVVDRKSIKCYRLFWAFLLIGSFSYAGMIISSLVTGII